MHLGHVDGLFECTVGRRINRRRWGMLEDWGVIEARREHGEVILGVVRVHIEGVLDGKHKGLF